MSVTVFKDCFFSLDAIDLSDHVKQASLDYSAEALDKTAMTNETRTKTGGLKDWSLTVEMYQDWSGSVDSTLFSRVGASTCAVILRPTTAAASTANPQNSGTALFEGYSPISGSVGELPMISLKFSAAGDLSRATA